jgi:hypothetical protein
VDVVKHLGKMSYDKEGKVVGKVTVCTDLELEKDNFVSLSENTNCLDCAWANIEHAKQVQKRQDELVDYRQQQMKKS